MFFPSNFRTGINFRRRCKHVIRKVGGGRYGEKKADNESTGRFRVASLGCADGSHVLPPLPVHAPPFIASPLTDSS